MKAKLGHDGPRQNPGMSYEPIGLSFRSGSSKSLRSGLIYHRTIKCIKTLVLNRGSYMSAHVFIEFIKRDACRAFYLHFATSLINSIIQMHEC